MKNSKKLMEKAERSAQSGAADHRDCSGAVFQHSADIAEHLAVLSDGGVLIILGMMFFIPGAREMAMTPMGERWAPA